MARKYDHWRGDRNDEADTRKRSNRLAELTLAAAVVALILFASTFKATA